MEKLWKCDNCDSYIDQYKIITKANYVDNSGIPESFTEYCKSCKEEVEYVGKLVSDRECIKIGNDNLMIKINNMIADIIKTYGKIHLPATRQGKFNEAFTWENGKLIFWFNPDSSDATLTAVVE